MLGNFTSHLPTWRLLLLSLAVTFLIIFPAAYQGVAINQPEAILISFINSSFYDYYGYYIGRLELSSVLGLSVSASGIVGAISSVLAYWIHRWIGGRKSLFITCTITLIIGTLLIVGAQPLNSFEMLISGYVINSGFSWTIASMLAPMYLSECSPPDKRGFCSTLPIFGGSFGYLMAYVLGLPNLLAAEKSWGFYFLLTVPISILGLFLTPFLPESPKEMHFKHRENSMAIALSLYGKSYNPQKILEDFHEEHSQALEKTIWIRDLYRIKHLRRATVIALVLQTLGLCCGPGILIYYTTLMFSDIGILADAQMSTIVTVIPMPLLALLGSFAVEKWGRRPMVIYGGIFEILCLVTYAIFALLSSSLHNYRLGYVAYAAAILNSWIAPLGPSSVMGFWMTEVLPKNACLSGMLLQNVYFNLCLAIVLLLLPPLHVLLGAWSVVITMIIPSTVSIVYLWLKLPETKGKPVNEIVRIWMDLDREIDSIGEKRL